MIKNWQTYKYASLSPRQLAGLNVLVVGSIIVINFVLRKIIESLTLLEKHKYYTHFLVSKISKVFVLLFCNTGLIIIFTVKFVDYPSSLDALFGQNGVVYSIQFIMLYSLVIPIIFSLVHPLHLIKTIRNWVLRRRLRMPRRNDKCTQAEANFIYEKNRFDIDYKYYSI